MQSQPRLPEYGRKLITHKQLSYSQHEATNTFFVVPKHILARKPGATGIYHGWVPGGGGDLWWVQHEDNSIGAYCYTELEFDE